MSTPHPSASELHEARTRFRDEARWQQFRSPRYRLPYCLWGSGRPFVFVHGMNDTTESFCMLMARLVDLGFQCIGYELPHGDGDEAILGSYKHIHYVQDLIELLDHLRYEGPVDLLGSSFGSTITLHALNQFPTRFRRAILQGGFARRPLRRIERGLARLGRYWPWRMNDLPIREFVMARWEKSQFTGCPPEIFEFLLECSGRSPIRAVARRALMIGKLDLRGKLASIPHPLLMIGGDRDPIVPRVYEHEVETGLPHARRVEFSPCGHYPQYTMPGPMADAMAEFLLEDMGPTHLASSHSEITLK